MKIKEFFENYKVDNNCVFHRISNRYVPIEEKQARAKLIVENAHYVTKEDGTKEFHMNSTAMYMMTCLTLVDLYTDIERSDNVLNDFNSLNEIGIFKLICQKVNKSEIEEFKNIIEWEQNDLMKNEYEIGGYVQRQVEKFALLVGNVLGPVIQEMDTDKLEAVLNKIKE